MATVHVPTATNVTVNPDTVQTAVVVEEKTGLSMDVAEPDTVATGPCTVGFVGKGLEKLTV